MLIELNRKQYKKIEHISDPCTLTIPNLFLAALIFIHLAAPYFEKSVGLLISHN
jgi:hypothetical protein